MREVDSEHANKITIQNVLQVKKNRNENDKCK